MSATQINPNQLLDDTEQLQAIAASWLAIRSGDSPALAMLATPLPSENPDPEPEPQAQSRRHWWPWAA